MYLLYCDESNLEEDQDRFFVYGGIAIASEQIEGLSSRIDSLRENAGIPTDLPLKFNPRPEQLSHDNYIDLKQSIIQAAVDYDCKLFTSIIHHGIATSANDARLKEINRVCYHFNCFLNRVKLPGLVLVDRFEDGQVGMHLREKFAVGLTDMPYSEKMRLEKIMGFHYSAIGQSHMCSLIDIVLGSYRFVINAVLANQHIETSLRITELIAPLFFREEGKESVSEIGLFFSPMQVKAARYREIYQQLHKFFADCGLNCEQRLQS